MSVNSSFFSIVYNIWDTNDTINRKIIEYDSEEISSDRDEDEQGNKYLLCLFKALIIGGTIFCYIGCIVFWVLQFEWFVYYGGTSNCSRNQALLAIQIVLVLLLSILPPVLQSGSIFTTAIVAFYCTFLVYRGLESDMEVIMVSS